MRPLAFVYYMKSFGYHISCFTPRGWYDVGLVSEAKIPHDCYCGQENLQKLIDAVRSNDRNELGLADGEHRAGLYQITNGKIRKII